MKVCLVKQAGAVGQQRREGLTSVTSLTHTNDEEKEPEEALLTQQQKANNLFSRMNICSYHYIFASACQICTFAHVPQLLL